MSRCQRQKGFGADNDMGMVLTIAMTLNGIANDLGLVLTKWHGKSVSTVNGPWISVEKMAWENGARFDLGMTYRRNGAGNDTRVGGLSAHIPNLIVDIALVPSI